MRHAILTIKIIFVIFRERKDVVCRRRGEGCKVREKGVKEEKVKD